MSDPEWNAIRWSYRRMLASYRRMLFGRFLMCAFGIVFGLWNLHARDWLPFAFAMVGTAALIAGAARMVTNLHDMQERLEWIEKHW